MEHTVVLTKSILVGGMIALLPTYQYAGEQYIEDVSLVELLRLVSDICADSHYNKETDTQTYVFDDLSQLTLVNVNQAEGPCEIRTKEIYDGLASRLSSEAHA